MKSDPVEAAIEAMERKPTAAAMRAAYTVVDALNLTSSHDAHIAEIIDRETGLPELIAACKAALSEMQAFRAYWRGPNMNLAKSKAKAEELCETAISKAEGT